jgi:iron(III) transport system permease protein
VLFRSLATRLWSATAIGRYAEAAPYALVLVALAAVPTWLITRRSGILPAAGEREPLTPVEVDEDTTTAELLEGVKA